MRKLSSFTFITLNGFYKGPNEDISWHRHGGEENEVAEQGSQSNGTLLFGRVTYAMMVQYWPTPMAAQQNPIVAEGMNKSEKIVFSRTLNNVDWQNTRLIKGDVIEEVRKMKGQTGNDLTLLGSGSILSQLAEHNLIDEYQIMLDPVALGNGTPLFGNMQRKLDLELTKTKTYKSGVIMLNYVPK